MIRDDAATMARELLDAHGLDGWSVGWNGRKTALGVCRYSDRRILLSGPLTDRNSVETMADVIRHEVAHALAGAQAKHGPQWRAACRVTGARPRSCADAASVETVPAPWRVVCRDHGDLGGYYRRPTAARLCRRCRQPVAVVRSAA